MNKFTSFLSRFSSVFIVIGMITICYAEEHDDEIEEVSWEDDSATVEEHEGHVHDEHVHEMDEDHDEHHEEDDDHEH